MEKIYKDAKIKFAGLVVTRWLQRKVMGVKLIQIFIFLVVCTILIHFTLSNIRNKSFDSQELDRQLKALQRVIDFIADRPEQMNIDAIFGLTLAEAHLISASSHFNVPLLTSKQQNNLKSLLKKCNNARERMKKSLFIGNEVDFFINKNMTEPTIWIHPIDWKSGSLKSPVPRKLTANYETYKKLILNGKPNEEESDYCIVNIIRGSEKNTCQLVDDCEMILLEDDDPQGYALTHRLLIVSAAKAFRCEELKTVSSDKLIPKYCSLILQNLIDFEGLGFPSHSPDLAIEEVLLCGAEGYLEFVNDHWLNIILNWQESSGCFKSFQKKQKYTSRRLKTSNQIDFECADHTTGIGVGTIALFIRHYIENINVNKQNYF